jgi:hypothetical protein
MAVKLHRCRATWIKGPHPCWRVEKALIDTGTEYERVLHPALRRNRQKYIAKTGQAVLPMIEFEDGRLFREESADLAARIRAGKLRDA